MRLRNARKGFQKDPGNRNDCMHQILRLTIRQSVVFQVFSFLIRCAMPKRGLGSWRCRKRIEAENKYNMMLTFNEWIFFVIVVALSIYIWQMAIWCDERSRSLICWRNKKKWIFWSNIFPWIGSDRSRPCFWSMTNTCWGTVFRTDFFCYDGLWFERFFFFGLLLIRDNRLVRNIKKKSCLGELVFFLFWCSSLNG